MRKPINYFLAALNTNIRGEQILERADERTKLYVRVSKEGEVVHFLPVEMSHGSLSREVFSLTDAREFTDANHDVWVHLYANWIQ